MTPKNLKIKIRLSNFQIININSDNDKDVVCYFINWAWYRPGAGKYKPEDIDPKLCTVVNYAFSVLGSNGKLRMHDSWADKDNSELNSFKPPL